MGQIVIYVDRGVSLVSLMSAVKSLSSAVDVQRHPIIKMDAQALRQEPWEKKTSLIVFLGGRDLFYQAALNPNGAERIRQFVLDGGSYLGICAGAYFASGEIEFEKGCHLEVCGKRPLMFFPGIARGSALHPGKFSYESERGSTAAEISWGDSSCHTYFNGGCFFENPEQYPDVNVLSRYLDLEGQPASIIECKVGEGKALLSGVHVEFSPGYLPNENPYLKSFLPLLERSEEKRRALMRDLLGRLL